MGPTTIIDKSILQGVSGFEALLVAQHTLIVVPPVLVLEILGDLSKGGYSRARREGLVRSLARRLPPIEAKATLHYRDLALGSLLGDEIPLDGRIPREPGAVVRDARGGVGVVYEVSPESIALQRWQRGEFLGAEEELAQRWRAMTTTVDVPQLQRRLREEHESALELASFEVVREYVAGVVWDPLRQPALVAKLLEHLCVDPATRSAVWARWNQGPPGLLSDFAPYACKIVETQLVFEIALANRLVSQRPTNGVDLEYLYYLPFCQVFLSGDRDQLRMAEVLARPDQMLFGRQTVQEDLTRLAQWHRRLTPERAAEYRRHYFHYPPPQPRTFLNEIWDRFMRPWRLFSGDAAPDHSPEAQQRIVDFLRPRMRATEAALQDRAKHERQD